ncbi:MAG: ABC transporter permease subunit, partial [SAR324 cluster bacterium]|nr:ABC transporter permease subunit [SAR324 cluster bacterium]
HESERLVPARLAMIPDGEALLSPMMFNGLSTVGPDKQYAKILAAIVPFLLVIMTITGAMYPAIDLTAGEKERGTAETTLLLPIPRLSVHLGKILTVALAALVAVLREPPPEQGSDPQALLSLLEREVFSPIGNLLHPRFFGFIPSPSTGSACWRNCWRAATIPSPPTGWRPPARQPSR